MDEGIITEIHSNSARYVAITYLWMQNTCAVALELLSQ